MSNLIKDDCNIFHLTQKLITTREVFLQINKNTKKIDLYGSIDDQTADNLFLYLDKDYNYNNMKGEIVLDIIPNPETSPLFDKISHNLLDTKLVENSENLTPSTYSVVCKSRDILMFRDVRPITETS